MRRFLVVVFRLGLKELYSLWRDPVLMALIVHAFTIAVYAVATGANTEVRNAAVAIVDQDRSQLSSRIGDAILAPQFQRPVQISLRDVDPAMDVGRFTFVLDIPPRFEADLLAGRRPAIQLNVDATAMTQAAAGARYLASIIDQEIATSVGIAPAASASPANLVLRARFNPNLSSPWFAAVMQVINSVTLLAIVLSGAALIREREHGTIEHLLVMPLRPTEIMLAKIWANSLVILVAAGLSIQLIVRGLLGVPVAGSLGLFLAGSALYLFAVTALGILLATVARSMPQFGLLAMPVFIMINLLSGSSTPLESMPAWLQNAMQISPSTHYVRFAQGVLYRGAGLDVLWPDLLAVAAIGGLYLSIAAARFRGTLQAAQG